MTNNDAVLWPCLPETINLQLVVFSISKSNELFDVRNNTLNHTIS